MECIIELLEEVILIFISSSQYKIEYTIYKYDSYGIR